MAQTKSTGGAKKNQGRKATAPQKTPKTARKKSTKTKTKPGTAQKTGTKKPAKKKGPNFFHELKKTVLGITILVAVCLTAAMLVDIFVNNNRPVAQKNPIAGKASPVAQPQVPVPLRQKPLPPETKNPAAAKPKIISKAQGLKEKEHTPGKPNITGTSVPQKGSAIVYEVYDDVTPHPPKKVVPPKKDDVVPRIAIIIDDIGYDKDLAMGLLNIDKNITFAILPFSPAGTHSLPTACRQKGRN